MKNAIEIVVYCLMVAGSLLLSALMTIGVPVAVVVACVYALQAMGVI